MKASASGKVERTAAEQALLPLKRHFDEWRSARRVGERIPRQLREAAAGAAALHGAYRVARVLGLDYAALRRRAAQPAAAAGQRTPALHFVGVPPASPALTRQKPLNISYQHRKEAERYSLRVPMARIEKEGCNLNISRYISTVLPEEKVDMAAMHQQLVAIEEEIVKAKDKHNKFLKELGWPLLP